MKNKKLLKLIMALSTLLPVSSLLISCNKTTNIEAISEKTMKIIEKRELKPETNNQLKKEILNFDTLLRHAVYFYWKEKNPDSKVSFIKNDDIKTDNLTFESNETSIFNEEHVIKGKPYLVYFSTTTVENKDNKYQQSKTVEFQESVEVSTTATVVWGFSHKTELNFGLKEKNFGGFNYELEYDNTETTTQIKIEKKKISSQLVSTPPGERRKVTVYLIAQQYDYKINLEQKISGQISVTIRDDKGDSVTYWINIGEAFKIMEKYQDLPKTITIIDDNTINFKGLAIISQVKSFNHTVKTEPY